MNSKSTISWGESLEAQNSDTEQNTESRDRSELHLFGITRKMLPEDKV